MKKSLMKLNILIIAAALTQACSSPSEEPSAEQSQQPAAQAEKNPAPVATTTPAVTSVPQPASATGPQPKLLVPVKKIDFGTQRAGKSLMRTITVKNTGEVELKIESVVPS
jgi:hypothetical protein